MSVKTEKQESATKREDQAALTFGAVKKSDSKSKKEVKVTVLPIIRP